MSGKQTTSCYLGVSSPKVAAGKRITTSSLVPKGDSETEKTQSIYYVPETKKAIVLGKIPPAEVVDVSTKRADEEGAAPATGKSPKTPIKDGTPKTKTPATGKSPQAPVKDGTPKTGTPATGKSPKTPVKDGTPKTGTPAATQGAAPAAGKPAQAPVKGGTPKTGTPAATQGAAPAAGKPPHAPVKGGTPRTGTPATTQGAAPAAGKPPHAPVKGGTPKTSKTGTPATTQGAASAAGRSPHTAVKGSIPKTAAPRTAPKSKKSKRLQNGAGSPVEAWPSAESTLTWDADGPKHIGVKMEEINPGLSDKMEHWAESVFAKGVHGLLDDYSKLCVETKLDPKEYVQCLLSHPAGRNRYEHFYCLDSSRVILQNHPKNNDYIHANYVDTPNTKKRFICTQAPLEATVFDFWWMVRQEEVDTIVMLGKFGEEEFEERFRYFPKNAFELTSADSVEVLCTQRDKLTDADNAEVYRRDLKVTLLDKTFYVRHFQWKDWSNVGVPPTRLSVVHFLRMVRGSTHPIVVHCSAGIGRTGTLVVFEYLMDLMSKDGFSDIAPILKNIRTQRAFAVQRGIQYLYIHRVMLFFLVMKKIVKKTPKLKQFIDEYEKYREDLSC